MTPGGYRRLPGVCPSRNAGAATFGRLDRHLPGQLTELHVHVGQPGQVDGLPAPEQRFDGVADIPNVDVHGCYYSPLQDPERNELTARRIPPEDDGVVLRCQPRYSIPRSYWSEKK